MTPDKLHTPDALVEAEDAEEALGDEEASEVGVEVDCWVCSEASNQSRFGEVVFLGLLGSHRVVSIDTLLSPHLEMLRLRR